ncbi:MAG TPA: glycosyltransferase family 39 protein [Candidatus Saccharimonadales bacterium]|nr:glycosyltransferase family 39 protein [Candidatus Saccharimonadales bacterium]
MSRTKPAEALTNLKDRLALAGALALGVVVMFTNITKSSIWHDEGYTMMLIPKAPLDILARTARDVHPPLHYLTLHYWTSLFGTSELAARSLSAVFMLGTIMVMFYLVKRLFGTAPARLAALFLALAPFLVRYAQEARMYAMVAFLLALATLFLVRWVEERRSRDLFWYALALAAALYTHYYAIFMIAVHWLFILALTLSPRWHLSGKTESFEPKQVPPHGPVSTTDSLRVTPEDRTRRSGLRNPDWWLANVLAFLLFLPWLPAAYAQFSRVQAAFWIPRVNADTLPHSLAQFLTFTSLPELTATGRLVGALVLVALVAAAVWFNRQHLPRWILLISYAALGPLAVFVLSFKRPIYVDRYFVFSAVAFYALLAVLPYTLPALTRQAWLRRLSIAVIVVMFGFGIRNVYQQSDHQMRTIGQTVSAQFQPGDELVSGELYTYFDFSYYNRTGQTLKLLAPGGLTGYGESSLLYDRADQIVVRDYRELKPSSGYVWVIGKTGQHDYFDRVPANWQPVGPKYQAGYSAAQRYVVR